jgi:hypothetical protein
MKTIRGHYNGSVVVLDEPAPVNHAVEVTVGFPEEAPEKQASDPAKKWHWDEAQALPDSFRGNVTDELLRQRQMD